ncbi:hypothetical protein KJY73_14255 [Bowmanella sp. Y26]|uniref:hypothetical protein n=1 Tax=Bowmanella yangjiangensis TaxID=2811230 RepID=UPI001BDC304C|nr:hypothetical protein [Bowmanella yangjiangensis]MBT1064750.1 hypothetical protein [Bowmanella yangjiangensis]
MAATPKSIVQLKDKLREFNNCLEADPSCVEEMRQLKQALESLLEELHIDSLPEPGK